ncbi:hypothetical protein [Flaviaesturariibacter aridisoli]|uniref:Uncharacterized protein n=1 Tax=Flaviaesturariibacter aridisoli TaxID=2545761 RepID=A0A4R4DZZ5_9BACT|nr:hypothetical protein [Flaviaesturariibacter aridisoli]TCZ67054.1 hypothetical protein E0486_16335 [Flaviaesturariibacter aridisoli]
MGLEIHPFVNGKWHANLTAVPQIWHVGGGYFGYLQPHNPQVLIVGSFPSYDVVNSVRKGGNLEFFYGSTDNNLWPVMSALTGMPVATEANCMQLLDELGCSMTDVLLQVDRNGTSSADKDLLNPQFNQIDALLQACPSIKVIFTTSGGKSPVNNGTDSCVTKWLRDHWMSWGVNPSGIGANTYRKQINLTHPFLTSRPVEVISLLSPSDSAFQSLQRIINANTLTVIMGALPNTLFTGKYNKPFNYLRVLQWGYHFERLGLPVEPRIQAVIRANAGQLGQIFS